MKNRILIISVLIFNLTIGIKAQNISISANGGTPDPSAMLDIQAINTGLSIPNVALTASNSSTPIAATPKTGLIVYNTATAGSSPNNVIPGFYFWNGSKWIPFYGNGSNNWTLGGNSGTAASTNFIGTADANDFTFNTNNVEVMRVTSAGLVGIGNTSPLAKLDVAAGTTTNNNVVNGTGKINDFLQFNIQNINTSSKAQSGYSATADNGTATTGFAWMGINNSTFNFPTAYNIGGANDVSYVASGQDMYIANANNTKSIIFSTGKSTTPFFNERMRLTNAGYLGIGTSSPVYPLDVNSISTSISTYAFLNAAGSKGTHAGSSGISPYSANFSGRITCPEFNAQSDARIKDVKGISHSENDLAILKKLKITDYEMKDKMQWGNKKFKKVIAQEVEKVYPQAVSTSTGFIPNIYQIASIVEITETSYKVSLEQPCDINKRMKKIRIQTDAGIHNMDVINILTNKTFVLKRGNITLKEGEKIFVYGAEIIDFRVVDYGALSTLAISSTQELYKILLTNQIQLDLLKKESFDLKTDLNIQLGSIKEQLENVRTKTLEQNTVYNK